MAILNILKSIWDKVLVIVFFTVLSIYEFSMITFEIRDLLGYEIEVLPYKIISIKGDKYYTVIAVRDNDTLTQEVKYRKRQVPVVGDSIGVRILKSTGEKMMGNWRFFLIIYFGAMIMAFSAFFSILKTCFVYWNKIDES